MNEIGLHGSQYAGTGPLYAVASVMSTNSGPTALAARLYVKAANGSASPFNASDWPLYAVPLSLATDGNWYGSFPPAAATGSYWLEVWEQSGTTPNRAADGDLDASGPLYWRAQPTPTGNALVDDFEGMLDFAEQVTYKRYSDNKTLLGTWIVDAVVDRQPEEVVSESGHPLTNTVQVCIANRDPITQIVPDRDKIYLTGRYGGQAKDHLVVLVLPSDAGVWTLRVKAGT